MQGLNQFEQIAIYAVLAARTVEVRWCVAGRVTRL